jgi:phasin family protein
MMTPEQLAAANQANIDAIVELTRKSFEGIERLVELNLQVARASMGDSAAQAKAMLSAKGPQDLVSLQAGMVQPATEKATAYSRQLYEIASQTQSEVTRLVEAQMAAAQEKILALVDATVKNAPAGSENAMVVIKSAVTAANSAMASVQQAAKQAVGVAEANLEAIAKNAAPAAPARKSSRKG